MTMTSLRAARSLLAASTKLNSFLTIRMAPLTCRNMSRFEGLKVWKRSSTDVVVEEEEGEEEDKYLEYQKSLEEEEASARKEFLETRRNKSKLTASHR